MEETPFKFNASSLYRDKVTSVYILMLRQNKVKYKLGGHDMIDFHMHSDFSADCNTPMEETIQAAINKGMKKICFTEHVDYDYPDDSIDFSLDVVRYDETIKQLQAKYADQITVKKGVEIGVQPHVLEESVQFVKDNDFDFIICSMHAADNKDLHYGTFYEGRTTEEAYEYYYKELLHCIERFEHYSVIGHLDLVKRYKPLDSGSNFHEIIREMFKLIIPQGKGIEINTSGFAYGLGSAMPSDDILKLYKECGGEIITIGSDAHEANHVGREFTQSLQLLKDIGFEYIASFDQLKPTFHKIDEIL